MILLPATLLDTARNRISMYNQGHRIWILDIYVIDSNYVHNILNTPPSRWCIQVVHTKLITNVINSRTSKRFGRNVCTPIFWLQEYVRMSPESIVTLTKWQLISMLSFLFKQASMQYEEQLHHYTQVQSR